MKRLAYIFLSAAVVLIVALLALTSHQKSELKMSLAVPERVRSTPIYVAMDKGYFAEEGISPTLTVPETGAQALAAVLDGKADFALSGGLPVIEAVRGGKPVSILAALSYADVHLGIIAAPGARIEKLHDLKGRRIAVVPGTSSELYLASILKSYGLAKSDVAIVATTAPQISELLRTGQADAASISQPWLDRIASAAGSDAIVLRDNGSFFDYWFLLGPAQSGPVTEKEIRLMRALAKANVFIRDYPKEASEIMRRHTEERSVDWLGTYFDLQLDESVLLNLQSNARLTSDGSPQPDFAKAMRPRPLAAVVPSAVRVAQ